MKLRRAAVAFCVIAPAAAFLLACDALSAPAAPGERRTTIEDGRLLAERDCSRCHAVERRGASPRPDAPVFRHILSRYRAGVLEDELVEGIKLGHPDMPQFKLNPKSVDSLIAYLRSIQQPHHRAHPR